MRSRKNIMVGIAIISIIIALDYLVQTWVFSALEDKRLIVVTPFFNFVEVWNHGISFGMFNKLPYGQWVLSLVALAVSAFLVQLLFRADGSFKAMSYGLIIGGAVGNVIDRISYGAVADYLDFHAFGYHWPSFNVTDSAIFLGVVFLLLPFSKHSKTALPANL